MIKKWAVHHSSIYAFLIVLLIFIVILAFFISTARIMARIDHNRAETNRLHVTLLRLKEQTTALIFAETPNIARENLQQSIESFKQELDRTISHSLFSTLPQVYPEISTNILWLKNNWTGIESLLSQILRDRNETTLDTATLAAVRTFTERIQEVSKILSDFDRNLQSLTGWIDHYNSKQVRAFQVLFYMLGAAIILFLFLMIGIIQDTTRRRATEAKIRNLTRSMIKAQEIERKKIALDLHDNVAQNLSALRIACNTIQNQILKKDPTLEADLDRFDTMIQGSITAARELAYDLRPPYLDQFGLVHSIQQYCENFSQLTGIDIKFSAVGMDHLKLEFDTEINLYRIIQEALSNIMKHAEASAAAVKLVASYPSIILRVEDNGVGFSMKQFQSFTQVDKHMGLHSMEERAGLLAGKMHITSQIAKGTKILVEVPIKEQ